MRCGVQPSALPYAAQCQVVTAHTTPLQIGGTWPQPNDRRYLQMRQKGTRVPAALLHSRTNLAADFHPTHILRTPCHAS